MANGIPTDPPVIRKQDWGAVVREAWGDEWMKHEKVYALGKSARSFESSDYGTSGLYVPRTAIVRAGSSTTVTANSIVLAANANGGPDDYVGKTITLSRDSAITETASIVGYNSTTRLAHIVPALDDYMTSAFVSGARTNLCPRSQEFNNAAWSSDASISANSTAAPDGTTTADTLTDDSAAAFLSSAQAFAVADDSLAYAFSIFVKKTTAETNTFGVNVSLTGGVAVSTNLRLNTNSGVVSGTGAEAQELEGYWRLLGTILNNSSGNTTLTVAVYPATSTNSGSDPGGDVATATGSHVVWGAQLEKASSASSYIPTTTASVERTTDEMTYSISA